MHEVACPLCSIAEIKDVTVRDLDGQADYCNPTVNVNLFFLSLSLSLVA